jgi:hypothetical protein
MRIRELQVESKSFEDESDNFYCYEDDGKTGIMIRMIRKG